jgi:hypothetical protein
MAEQPSQRGSGQLLDFAHAPPQNQPGGQATGGPNRTPLFVSFNRLELTTILNVYGRKVANGEWRDYAIDFLRERALFSIYKRSSERPIFVVEKNPKLRNKQGQYLVTSQEGRVLKRGHELENVLRVLELAVVK